MAAVCCAETSCTCTFPVTLLAWQQHGLAVLHVGAEMGMYNTLKWYTYMHVWVGGHVKVGILLTDHTSQREDSVQLASISMEQCVLSAWLRLVLVVFENTFH